LAAPHRTLTTSEQLEVAMADRIEARRRRIVSTAVSTPPEVDWHAQATLERQQRDQQHKLNRIETQAEAKRQHAATSPRADLVTFRSGGRRPLGA
jgi:hypothetical protein